MNTNNDKAKRLIEAALQANDRPSLISQLGQHVLFKARAAAAMHVTLMGGNPAAPSEQGSESS